MQSSARHTDRAEKGAGYVLSCAMPLRPTGWRWGLSLIKHGDGKTRWADIEESVTAPRLLWMESRPQFRLVPLLAGSLLLVIFLEVWRRQ